MKLPSICRKAVPARASPTHRPLPDPVVSGIDLPEQVMQTPCIFGVIAEFSSVNDLLSLATSSRAMGKAVTGLRHWKCGGENDYGGPCENHVFCSFGVTDDCTVPSCCRQCKTKLCSMCTVRCQSCHEIKCLDCDLDLCEPCNSWNCLECKFGPPCTECGTVYS